MLVGIGNCVPAESFLRATFRKSPEVLHLGRIGQQHAHLRGEVGRVVKGKVPPGMSKHLAVLRHVVRQYGVAMTKGFD